MVRDIGTKIENYKIIYFLFTIIIINRLHGRRKDGWCVEDDMSTKGESAEMTADRGRWRKHIMLFRRHISGKWTKI